ncbi:MAG: GGDEF domain-containing protein [Acidobacteriaceae bacterium]|nr:GGDEF domain-containing protein [Acidobacteriaceae bacterium]
MMPHWQFDPASVFLAGTAVELMFACTMLVIALSDRRTQGTRWFSAMAALNLVGTSFRLWHGRDDRLIWDIRFAAWALLTGFLMHGGVQWFAARRKPKYQPWILLVTVVLFLCGINPGSRQLEILFLLRVAALALYGHMMWMLWRPKLVALQTATRWSAFSLVLMALLRIVRMLMHLGLLPAASSAGLDHLRELGLAATMFTELSFVALYVAEVKMRLHEETRIDVLTGLKNRRAFEELAQRAVETAVARGYALSMLMLDLDHFKTLNDTWGHVVGDRALSLVGSVLVNTMGDGMLVMRLGGEEFAVLLPEMEMDEAQAVAETLRAAVAKLKLSQDGEEVSVTASLGVSSLQRGEVTWQLMLQRADVALYRAKAAGRNRVERCVAGTHPPMPHSGEMSAWQRMFRGQGPLL